MNIQPFRPAPRWWSPKLSPFWQRVWRPLRRRMQRREQRLVQVDVSGLGSLREAVDAGHGVLIAVNHPGHADAYALYDAADQLGCPFYFLTAWQVFAMSGPLTRLILRHHGCFSIERERTDMRAFKKAVAILEKSPYPLVIFPEGEVYHCNDRVTPFLEGTSAIALTAAKRAKRQVVCVPCGLKYHYVEDPTPELNRLMDELEQRIFWRPRPDLPLADRVYRFAEGALALKEVEYLGRNQQGSLPERIGGLSHTVLAGLEEQYGMRSNEATIPERVKALRSQAIKKGEAAMDDPEAQQQAARDLEDLFFVVQLFSYPGDYVAERPTVERLAETLDKFEEDVLHVPTATIRGARRAVLSFGEPIIVEGARGQKQAVRTLTETLEKRVQALLDAIEPPRQPDLR